jgi:hypothetical protein
MVLLNVARLRLVVMGFLAGFNTPEKLKELFTLVAHGVLRAVQERAGSIAGVAAKQNKANIIDTVLGGGGAAAGALAAIPGKIDLPIVGKVTIGEALQLFQTLKGVLGSGGIQIPGLNQSAGSGRGGSVLP